MSFSLYGDLPKPKSAKNETGKGPEGSNDVAKAWAAVAPPTTTAPATQEPIALTNCWALYNQFRPVMRKPTIQAKPKINKPVIPVGGKIVSTISAQTYQATANEKAATATTSPPVTLQNAMSLKTSTDDVNGFADLPSNAKRAKKIHKHKQKDAQTLIEFDMMEDYDPIRPNDYEMYMEQQNRMKEDEERRRLEQMFAPPESLVISETSTTGSSKSDPLETEASDIVAGGGAKADAFVSPAIPINLEETAEDAWMRRARLSGKTNVASVQRSTSNPEPNVDGSRTGNIDVSNHGIHQHDPSTAKPSGNMLLQGHDVASAAATEIVLLTNMVGPGEVDDTLQHETADECGKYGKVERCLIFEVPESQVGANQAVRIFVKFHSTIAAQRAVDDLNGRYFGGRVVTATFFDAARFERLDLAPTKEEMITFGLQKKLYRNIE
ncbi:unnamed protein product [Umbelopsis vinacea]